MAALTDKEKAQLAELQKRSDAETAAQAANEWTAEQRPYREIKDEDGNVLCATPEDGGPVRIGPNHPEDVFKPNDKGVGKAASAATTTSGKDS